MNTISFDLTRTSRDPGWNPDAAASHDALWRQFVANASYTLEGSAILQTLATTAGQGFTFNAAQGDVAFKRLAFADGGGSMGTASATQRSVVTLDWITPDSALLRLDASWNSIKNAEVSQFTGTALRIENFVDVWVHLADDASRSITLDGAKRGEVTTAGGADVITIGIETNNAGWTNEFLVRSGAGNDVITFRMTEREAVSGIYQGQWTETTTFAEAGDDTIFGWGSNDIVDGGSGADLFVLRGLRAGYNITTTAGVTTIVDINAADGNDGRDRLTDVERIQFRDGSFLDLGAPPPGNVAPDARNDTILLTAAAPGSLLGTVALTAALLDNDLDPEGLPLTISAVDPSSLGTIALSAGTVQFSMSDAAYRALGAGQQASGSFTYTVRDAGGLTDTAVATIMVTGVNDAASISGSATGVVDEDGTLTASGTLTVSDADTGEALFATPASLAGTYGSFSFDAATGAWGYALDNAAASVQALADGQTVTDTLTIASLDGTASQAITVSIAGINDAASITGSSTGAVAEDGTLTASGTLTVSDVDTGEAGFAAPGSLAGIYGSFSFDAATGAWGYALNNAAANVQALANGQTVTDALTIASLDGTASQAITVSIAGTNDAASITGSSTGAVAEDGTLTASGTMAVSDVDTGEASFATPGSLAGIYGSFSFDAATGAWGYALNNAAAHVQALANGQTVTDTLTIASLDGTASQAITVSIAGTNDAASITGSSTGVVAEDGTLTASGTLTVSDVDTGEASFAAPGSLAGIYGSFSFDATTGVWGYALNGSAANVQALSAGQVVTDVLNVASLDGTASQAITVSINGAGAAPAAPRIDLSLITPAEGFIIQGDSAGDAAGWSVSSAGDVNGDGFADLIIGARGGDDGGAEAGEAYVVFGGAGGFGTLVGGRRVLDLTTLTPAQGFIIQGDLANDRTGYSVASAGDVNGDGFSDLIIGATLGKINSANSTAGGTAHVVFGGASGFGTAVGARQVLDLTTLSAAQGFTIRGRQSGSDTGKSVSSAGDVNGDGFADLIVGAPMFNLAFASQLNEGAAFVIFGGAGVFGSAQTVAGVSRQFVTTLPLTERQGFSIFSPGLDQGNSGQSVSAAGDVNGDGFSDFIVGVPYGSNSIGKALVVFGGTDGIGALQSGSRSLDTWRVTPAQGFVIQGDAAGDRTGVSVSSAGDVNGDGFADLIIGAYTGDDGGNNAGEAYVVFGAAGGPGTAVANAIGVIQQVVNLTTLTAAQGFIIQADTALDFVGRSVASAGDVNGDGFADVIVGANGGDDGGNSAGEAYVLFGGAGGFGVADAAGRRVVDLTTLTASQGLIIQGDVAEDQAGFAVSSAGDINGDGFADLIVGAPFGDDGGSSAGEAYVLYGAAFGASAAPVNTTGTSAADILMGGAGNDSLSGGGGADALRGGAGNDRLGVADSAFRHVNGGAGTDTLVLTGGGQMLDLTTIASGRLTSIEAFDLTGTGDNTLVIRADDIFMLGGAADAAWTFSALPAALVVNGNAGDTLDLRDLDPDGVGAALNRAWVKVLNDVTFSGAAGGAYDVWELQAGMAKLAAIAAHNDLNIL
jgi:VCBS repeat-containing protein